ncbi:ABC transporter permease [Paenibacillus cremeus]|uniref:ABC transporter permease n=1 Tax=Paenibacillus cremeus TaxID=2163881 RepID=A0A559K713_9BACL|nr:ABC transporter permease [Paenibacillus cremeus]TVY07907.1 ABC transporter permease [Paenibacillus cremeus]
MVLYSVKKLAQMALTLLGVVTLVFFALRLIPGDAASALAGDHLSAAAMADLREKLGLNRPLWQQYLQYLGHLVQLDFGNTITTSLSIKGLLAKALPITVLIAVCTVVFSVLVAIPLGTLAAYMANRGKKMLDNALMSLAMVVDLMPSFWMALLLMLLLSLSLHLLPATGPISFDRPEFMLRRMALPIAVLSISQIASLARITRTSVLEVLNEDYVKTARALGTPNLAVVFRHALRNAALPIVTVVGLSFGHLLNGTVITEFIFSIPGVGTLLVNGINSRDYPLVQNVILVYAALFILVNVVTDLVYKKLDPRVQF